MFKKKKKKQNNNKKKKKKELIQFVMWPNIYTKIARIAQQD